VKKNKKIVKKLNKDRNSLLKLVHVQTSKAVVNCDDNFSQKKIFERRSIFPDTKTTELHNIFWGATTLSILAFRIMPLSIKG
jgi:hypothetical protein